MAVPIIDAVLVDSDHSGTSAGTDAFTCTGALGALLVQFTCQTVRTVSSVTYNGVAMSLLATRVGTGGGWGAHTTRLYGLLLPATGAHNIVVTLDSNSTAFRTSALSFTNTLVFGETTTGENTATGTFDIAVSTVLSNTLTVGFLTTAAGDGVSGALTSQYGTTPAISGAYTSNSGQSAPSTTTIEATGSSSGWIGFAIALSASLQNSGRMFSVF